MDQLEIKYAEALFDIAEEENSIKRYQEQIDFVTKVFKDDEVKQFLTTYFLDKKTKQKILKAVFRDDLDLMVLNFLCLLVDHHRMKHWELIAQSFHDQCNDALGIQEGIVYSVQLLSNKEKQKVEKALSEYLKKQIILVNEIDSTLIGGIKVMIGEHVFDDSMTSRIQRLKSTLLESR